MHAGFCVCGEGRVEARAEGVGDGSDAVDREECDNFDIVLLISEGSVVARKGYANVVPAI